VPNVLYSGEKRRHPIVLPIRYVGEDLRRGWRVRKLLHDFASLISRLVARKHRQQERARVIEFYRPVRLQAAPLSSGKTPTGCHPSRG
jgi:hypothetical protein